MTRHLRPASASVLAALACAGALTAGAARAQGVPLADQDLSGVWGQALLDLTQTSLGGYDFSRITLGADIRLSANFTGMRLGQYDYAPRNATGADIDLGTLRFGRSDGTDAQRTVLIANPYFEFVYKNSADPLTREVIGMRLGFGGITGDIGLQMNTVSGSLLINTDANGTISTANDPLGGKRWDGLTGCATCTVPLSQIGGVTAGDANGASRDFYISLLKTALVFPAVDPNTGTPAQAMAGFWMNWTDRLKAINVTGAVPPNAPKTGP